MWVLDEKTLLPIPGAKVPRGEPLVPSAFTKVESTFPGLKKQIHRDTGEPPPGTRYALTWETLEERQPARTCVA